MPLPFECYALKCLSNFLSIYPDRNFRTKYFGFERVRVDDRKIY